MRRLAHITLVATSLLLVALLPVPRTASPPAARCAAAKMRAAGKAARARLACVASATVAGTDEDAGCHGRADERLLAGIARAESHSGCLTTNDGPLVAVRVEACVAALREALRPRIQASTCTGGKLKTSGATIFGKLNCQRAGALRSAPASPSCLAKRDGRLDAKFTKLDPGASCLTIGDARPILALIDHCVSQVMGPIPATTTTSLVSVPTTTTTTIVGATTSSTVVESSSTTSTTSPVSSTSSSTSTTSTSSTTSTVVYTCGGVAPVCGGTCPPGQTCSGILVVCSCQ